MGKKKSLPTVGAGEDTLGADTIMDRLLAARYGVPYVHMAVFAIDVDRVRAWVEATQAPEPPAEQPPAHGDVDADTWPFAWEVFLTEVYLLGWVDPHDETQRCMVEDTCLELVEQPCAEPPLGAQLPFAVYDAVRRGAWPETLLPVFRSWKRRADPMTRELAPLWESPADRAASLAERCLDANMDPPLADPTLDALTAIEAGELELPGSGAPA